MNRNIKYRSMQISQFYSCNRNKWMDFYSSERWVFEKIADERKGLGDILDIGCACGGLSKALSEKFSFASYTGIDINEAAINLAQQQVKVGKPITFIPGDILELDVNRQYDLVVSLSCADWNIEIDKMIEKCWTIVKTGGYFIISMKITNEKGINDIQKSYQYINFSGVEKKPEIAIYTVFNFKDTLIRFSGLSPRPKLIGAYGYWKEPSPMAITPFKKVVFAVFYIKKALEGLNYNASSTDTVFNLPMDIF